MTEFSEQLDQAIDAAPATVTRLRPEPVSPVAGQWMRFRDRFAEALEGSFHSLADVEQGVLTSRYVFLPGKDAAIVAQAHDYPGERVMETMWAVGDVEEVVSLAPGLEATARVMGCTSVLVEGRKGWERVLKAQGYEPWSVTVRKGLT